MGAAHPTRGRSPGDCTVALATSALEVIVNDPADLASNNLLSFSCWFKLCCGGELFYIFGCAALAVIVPYLGSPLCLSNCCSSGCILLTIFIVVITVNLVHWPIC